MNPSEKYRRSPASVARDLAYEPIEEAEIYPNTIRVVFRHKKSNTFWMTSYVVRDSIDDYVQPSTWHEVVPRTITRVIYEVKHG